MSERAILAVKNIKWSESVMKSGTFAILKLWSKIILQTIDIFGSNSKNKKATVFPNLTSADGWVEHGQGLPTLCPLSLLKTSYSRVP